MKDRIKWVDNLRGLCMMAILFDHTEHYYLGDNISNLNLYVTDALYVFFVISGYLIYKNDEIINVSHKLKSILKTLVMPYFIFTTLMALPKSIAHGEVFDLEGVVIGIITGQASWFVAALAVAEILFVMSLKFLRGNIKWLFFVCVGAFGASIWLSLNNDSYIWQFDNALQAMLFLFIGYTYHKYETYIKMGFSVVALSLIALVVIKYYVAMECITMTVWHINISNYSVFFANVMVGSIAIIGLFRHLKSCPVLEWTGRHSLVYYFLCGGIPLIVGKIALCLGFHYDNNYAKVFVVFFFVYVITTALTWAVYRYIPFVVGK